MAISVISTGTPEVANEVGKIADELLYAIGRHMDLERIALPKPDVIVLCIYAIAPERGVIPDKTSFKRADREFWSSRNIDFARYVGGDMATKIDAVKTALIDAFDRVPTSRAPNDAKRDFRAAITAAAQNLLAEPERLTYRQR
ncbi:MAG: hypothetical protein J7515_01570 [Caulobacter sp.]|nr:hypothetical protein [Caulobacter sp.]